MANGNFGGGNGTEFNPFLIEDGADFLAMNNHKGSHFKQVRNISVRYTSVTDIIGYRESWASLSEGGGAFYGCYDGNGWGIDFTSTNDYPLLFWHLAPPAVLKNMRFTSYNATFYCGRLGSRGNIGYTALVANRIQQKASGDKMPGKHVRIENMIIEGVNLNSTSSLREELNVLVGTVNDFIEIDGLTVKGELRGLAGIYITNRNSCGRDGDFGRLKAKGLHVDLKVQDYFSKHTGSGPSWFYISPFPSTFESDSCSMKLRIGKDIGAIQVALGPISIRGRLQGSVYDSYFQIIDESDNELERRQVNLGSADSDSIPVFDKYGNPGPIEVHYSTWEETKHLGMYPDRQLYKNVLLHFDKSYVVNHRLAGLKIIEDPWASVFPSRGLVTKNEHYVWPEDLDVYHSHDSRWVEKTMALRDVDRPVFLSNKYGEAIGKAIAMTGLRELYIDCGEVLGDKTHYEITIQQTAVHGTGRWTSLPLSLSPPIEYRSFLDTYAPPSIEFAAPLKLKTEVDIPRNPGLELLGDEVRLIGRGSEIGSSIKYEIGNLNEEQDIDILYEKTVQEIEPKADYRVDFSRDSTPFELAQSYYAIATPIQYVGEKHRRPVSVKFGPINANHMAEVPDIMCLGPQAFMRNNGGTGEYVTLTLSKAPPYKKEDGDTIRGVSAFLDIELKNDGEENEVEITDAIMQQGPGHYRVYAISYDKNEQGNRIFSGYSDNSPYTSVLRFPKMLPPVIHEDTYEIRWTGETEGFDFGDNPPEDLTNALKSLPDYTGVKVRVYDAKTQKMREVIDNA